MSEPPAAPPPDQPYESVPPETPKESAKALAAWQDYWDMGPTRSLGKLHDLYTQRLAAGLSVPTRNLRQLEIWSSKYRWQDRVAAAMFDVHEQTNKALVGARAKYAEMRLNEARALHSAAGQVVAEMLRRIQAGDLQNAAFLGYWTTLPFHVESVEEDWEACPDTGCQAATGQAHAACPTCKGSGRKLIGKGRRKVQSGTRVVKIDGLMDLAGAVTKMLATGQKAERVELGEDRRDNDELEAILNALSPDAREQLAADLTAALPPGKTR